MVKDPQKQVPMIFHFPFYQNSINFNLTNEVNLKTQVGFVIQEQTL